jgi:NNP family nitrate/nitrite transporter-like MFS transporter
MNDQNGAVVPFRSHIPLLLCLVGMHFLNVISRIILAPLMPTVEGDLHIGHGAAGSLFLSIALGVSVGLLGSGFISSRFTHRSTISLSSITVGGSLLAISLGDTLWGIQSGLILLGLSAGIYFPSAIATLTAMVSPKDWGKALGIHQGAPNLAFVAAPLLAEVLMLWFSWRGVMAFIGGTAIIAGIAFTRFGGGGAFSGEAPNTKTFRILITQPSFWIMIAFFGVGIGAYLGIYNMLSLYLVAEHGLERDWANTLLALSRIAGLGAVFLAGWATDLFGPRRALGSGFIATGMATVLLGMARGGWIIPVLFLQPVLANCFFPAGLAALSRIGPPQVRTAAVSFTMPLGFFLGAGALPAGIGILGGAGFFSLGIVLVGVLLLGSIILLRFLTFHGDAIHGTA